MKKRDELFNYLNGWAELNKERELIMINPYREGYKQAIKDIMNKLYPNNLNQRIIKEMMK